MTGITSLCTPEGSLAWPAKQGTWYEEGTSAVHKVVVADQRLPKGAEEDAILCRCPLVQAEVGGKDKGCGTAQAVAGDIHFAVATNGIHGGHDLRSNHIVRPAFPRGGTGFFQKSCQGNESVLHAAFLVRANVMSMHTPHLVWK